MSFKPVKSYFANKVLFQMRYLGSFVRSAPPQPLFNLFVRMVILNEKCAAVSLGCVDRILRP